ncbi:T9SS type B sorting domain-containing protein [Flavivirga abyssicola]|uniref:T9SS type B sorting domain-containing protein n=1 Tax=Flavivirga abyssicola TaxID=3063533 RepID=UPI0026DFFE10|nr:T9SS type B sorting domain-containing protein [Flavivirga sp. MEBiC07777]WVK12352.1 T9SS type B sorting domain-containing protein [Flavivirga sp. MEBiC07777]
MRTIVLLIMACCLACSNIFAQKQAANWYFGENAGLRFDLDTNSLIVLNDGQLNTREGCASISDSFGNLLFYSDGVTVWNRNHAVMANGNNLYGDASSTQSAIIIPKPGDPTIYYIFTVDNNLDGANFGLNYSIVDISLNAGLGEVVSKNSNLLRECSEKITAVLKNCNSEDLWVLTLAAEDGSTTPGVFNTFHAFEVTALGVNPVSQKSTFNINISDARGYLKLSPDGTKVACANVRDGLYLYDFDSDLGTVSNQLQIRIPSTSRYPYGVEFSPNSQLLYVHSSNDYFDATGGEDPTTHTSVLSQFDLTAADIRRSIVTLDDRQLFRGGLQLGPNGKIYRALSSTYEQGQYFLGVIENPNRVGIACNYNHFAVDLRGASSQGLPPFITSFFNTEIDIIRNGLSTVNLLLCDGKSYELIADEIVGATYIWTKDGITLTENDFNLEVTEAGHYEVYIDPNNGDCALVGQAFVNYTTNPIANDATLIQCDEDGLVDGLTRFNLNEANDLLTGGDPNLSTVFYLNATDASINNTVNAINASNFSNTINQQIIHVAVVNNATKCYSNSELTLDVSTTNSGNTQLTGCDDDGIEDGFFEFNLNEAESDIVNGLPSGVNTSYFESYTDALLEQNKLDTFFTNTIPYSQTIYARVENANDCYGISEILLIVNQLPEIETEELTYYCLNTFPQTITINADTINNASTNYTYNWSTGDNTYDIQINQSGTYTVTVTNDNGCFKTRNITVETSNIATINAIEVVDASQNNTITVSVSGEGLYEYALLNNDGVQTPFQTNPVFENVFPGIYTVIVNDYENNCGAIDDQVSVIGFPKFFTPNNDGVHDKWQVLGISDMFQANSKILIYNRFGKLIKQLNPLGEGWDGRFNGEKLPTDDYWFAVTLQDGRVLKNHFTLKR